MQKLKNRWEITQQWQLLFPMLGAVLLFATSYLITKRLLHLFDVNNTAWEWPFMVAVSFLGYYLGLRFFLWCFKKLEHKWVVGQKWEMIAIFIVFAITGSSAARLAAPILDFIGLYPESISAWLYWPIRIVLILPLYQILLLLFGWLFGQFQFFWAFEKKMLKRMGVGFIFKWIESKL